MDTTEHEDALYERLLNQAINGCCGNAQWRGHLCQFHDGYAQGLETGMDAVTSQLPRFCRGGLSARDTDDRAACPGCGRRFDTLTDLPSFPPHLLHQDGTVTFTLTSFDEGRA